MFKVGQKLKSKLDDPLWDNCILTVDRIDDRYMVCHHSINECQYEYRISTWINVFNVELMKEVKKKGHLPIWW